MKPLNLRTEEIRELQETGRARVVRENKNGLPWFRSPLGQPGDEFWVREVFTRCQVMYSVAHQDGRAFSEIGDGSALYKADGYASIEDAREHVKLMMGIDCEKVYIEDDSWKPPEDIPQWASRYTIKTRSVNVEQIDGVWHWVGVVEVV